MSAVMVSAWRRWAGRVARGSRGTVSVELAFVAPILVLLALGSMEMGLQWRAASDVAGATRAGARALTHINGESTLAPQSDREALRTIEASLDERWDDVVSITVYDGEFDSCDAAGSRCNRYTNAVDLDNDGLWGCAGLAYDRAWCPTNRDRGAEGGTDAVAVEIQIEVEWETGVVSLGSRTITRRTVMRIEPEAS